MPVMTRTTLTDVLVQTIESNAEMLLLLDPERLQNILERFRAKREALKTPISQEAWDDLDYWIAEHRKQDIAQVDAG